MRRRLAVVAALFAAAIAVAAAVLWADRGEDPEIQRIGRLAVLTGGPCDATVRFVPRAAADRWPGTDRAVDAVCGTDGYDVPPAIVGRFPSSEAALREIGRLRLLRRSATTFCISGRYVTLTLYAPNDLEYAAAVREAGRMTKRFCRAVGGRRLAVRGRYAPARTRWLDPPGVQTSIATS